MLRGRESERAAVSALLDGARAGRGGALVLRGIAGAGKSSLLADAVAAADGMVVLRTVGVESESPLPFAGLQRLVRPVMDRLGALPARQADALRAALGEGAAEAPDRFLIYLATLGLLGEAAEERPVLAVVDDAHWLDDASAGALLFTARRLEIERVAVLFAARRGDVRTFDAGDLPVLDVGGLGAAAAAELLSARAGRDVPAGVAEALVRATDGNALALVELGDALPAGCLAGETPLPDPLPLTEGVERAFLGRYRQLPPSAQTVLLAAAADDSGDVTALTRAAADLGAEDGLEAAELSGLLHVRGAAVTLHHPLVRSAVYGSATTAERRRAHRALAAALTGADDADRRAWHLAAAVTGPDPAVVAELDRAAERARRRGGHEAASAAWERAAELCTDEEDRALRLYRAASAAWQAALPERARNLARAAHPAGPQLLADLLRLRAQVEFNTGSGAAGHRLLLEGATGVAPHDPGRAAEMAMIAVALAAFGAASDGGPDPAGLAPAPPPGAPPRERCLSDLVRGLAAVTRRDWRTAGPHLRRALAVAPQLSDEADADLLINLGVATTHLGDDELGLRLQDRLLAEARASGSVFNLLHALTRRNFAEIATGRWAAARASAQEAVTLAENTGFRGAATMPTAVLAVLAARRGEDPGPLLAAVEALLTASPQALLADTVEDLLTWARAVGTDADPVTAVQQLAELRTEVMRQLAATDRLESAARAERPDLVAEWAAELAEFGEGVGAPWAVAAAEHGRALIADDPDPHFRAALDAHAGSARVPDRARTQLAYGEFLRRSRRRVAAREQLRAALATFEDLGAEPLAARARQELRASGETARRRDAAVPVTELTPQESHVAQLVSRGLSNREVAAELFLSPRTIDFHLRNVFAKLGITHRTELVTRVLAEAH